MASRQKYLDELDQFLENCQAKVTAMLDTLGWTPDHFIQPKKSVQCPHDRNHTMSPAALQKHQPVCELIQQGCTKEEAEKILDNSDYFYEGASCVNKVKIDKEILNSALWNYHVKNHSVYYGHSTMPLTPDQEAQMLSREDRLGLAEYVIAKSREANRLASLEKDELMASANLADLIKTDDEKRPLDPVEEMAALRDYRRRRQSYRAKNVHITKKSHTEIMREVINNQMEMYSKQLQDEALETQSHMQDRVNRMLESVKEEVEEGEYGEPSHSYDSSGKSREPDRRSRQSRERSRDRTRERSSDRTRERDSKHRDKDSRRHKHKKSRSRSRSRSRDRYKSHKKHRKHKHKSHHQDRQESPASNSVTEDDSVYNDK